jgi:hypothetical protein
MLGRQFAMAPWILFTGFFALVLGRSITSIHHLIPDPGLTFQLTAQSDQLSDVFGPYGGYPQVLPRLISEILNLTPLSQLTYWATIINAAVIALCATIATKAVTKVVASPIALSIGLALAIAFPAYEGLTGNVWALRWTLLPTACIVIATDFYKDRWISATLLFLLTGLSHAYIFIPAIFFLGKMLVNRDRKLASVVPCASLLATSMFQGAVFLTGTRHGRLYGEATIYWPWTGAGIYWFSVFILPLTLALLSVLFVASRLRQRREWTAPQTVLALQGAALALLSYLQLGIKSSPAVSTIPLTYAALLLAYQSPLQSHSIRIFKKMSAVACSILLIVLTARYYLASPYLTNGERWSDIVDAATSQCGDRVSPSVELVYFVSGDFTNSEVLTCDQLVNWDKWIFER